MEREQSSGCSLFLQLPAGAGMITGRHQDYSGAPASSQTACDCMVNEIDSGARPYDVLNAAAHPMRDLLKMISAKKGCFIFLSATNRPVCYRTFRMLVVYDSF